MGVLPREDARYFVVYDYPRINHTEMNAPNRLFDQAFTVQVLPWQKTLESLRMINGINEKIQLIILDGRSYSGDVHCLIPCVLTFRFPFSDFLL